MRARSAVEETRDTTVLITSVVPLPGSTFEIRFEGDDAETVKMVWGDESLPAKDSDIGKQNPQYGSKR